MKIEFAKHTDFPALQRMWSLCFGDSEAAAENIFGKLQKPETVIAGVVDGKTVSMLSFREFTLSSPGYEAKAAYIYGVATLPEYRGRGYSGGLLEYAGDALKRSGFTCSALVPATEALFGFYAKRGFSNAFNINKATVEADGDRAFELYPLSSSQLAAIRNAYFSDSQMYARWDEEYLSYIIEESIFYGGGAFVFDCGDGNGCAVCHRSGDTVYVKELCAPPQAVDAALRSVLDYFGAKRLIAYLCEDVKTSYTNNLLPFGMIKWYDNTVKHEMSGGSGASAYLAHVLD